MTLEHRVAGRWGANPRRALQRRTSFSLATCSGSRCCDALRWIPNHTARNVDPFRFTAALLRLPRYLLSTSSFFSASSEARKQNTDVFNASGIVFAGGLQPGECQPDRLAGCCLLRVQLVAEAASCICQAVPRLARSPRNHPLEKPCHVWVLCLDTSGPQEWVTGETGGYYCRELQSIRKAPYTLNPAMRASSLLSRREKTLRRRHPGLPPGRARPVSDMLVPKAPSSL